MNKQNDKRLKGVGGAIGNSPKKERESTLGIFLGEPTA